MLVWHLERYDTACLDCGLHVLHRVRCFNLLSLAAITQDLLRVTLPALDEASTRLGKISLREDTVRTALVDPSGKPT